MLSRIPRHHFQIWLLIAALFGTQLVLAEHAYQHNSDPHPVSCELCIQGANGTDDGLCQADNLFFSAASNVHHGATPSQPDHDHAVSIGHRPRAPPQI